MIHPIKAYRNPRTRPRALIWTGAVVLFVIALVSVALAVTSTNWFCAEGCHKVQDDAVNSFNRSVHSKMSCLSCHMPVGGGPISFLIHKAEAGIHELPPTIFNTYHSPINPDSELALDTKSFPSAQCTQCHTIRAKGTETVGELKINHPMHLQAGLQCTWCHNRVAHNEVGLKLVGKDPKTGKAATPHTNYISMEGCFRCHTLNGTGVKSQCTTCHVTQPTAPPADHTKAFINGDHSKVVDAQGEYALKQDDGKHEDKELPSHFKSAGDLPRAIKDERSCYNCHTTEFCADCHRKGVYPNN